MQRLPGQDAARNGSSVRTGPAAGSNPALLRAPRASTPVIQRAVGFEFETNWMVSHADGSPFAKYDPIYTGAGWRMEADEPAHGLSDVEFVVKPPFEETAGGLANLQATMAALQAFFGNLTAAAGGKGNLLQNAAANPYVDGPLQNDVILQAGDPTATPQTTVGVRLERLMVLLDELSRPGSDAKEELLGLGGRSDANAATLDTVTDAISGVPGKAPIHDRNRMGTGYVPSQAMRGLMAMIALYLRRGAIIPGLDPYAQAFKYAKMVAIIMGRTDFGGMFAQLPNTERDYYLTHPDHWVQFALDTAKDAFPAANFAPAGNVIARGLKGAPPKYHPQTAQMTKPGKVIPIPVSRRDWLMGMPLGHDLLTAGTFEQFNPGRQANFSGAFGALGKRTDKVGPPGPLGGAGAFKGVILELREVKHDRHYLDWAQFAEDVFNYILALNAYTPGVGAAPQYQKTATPGRGVRD